MYGLGLTALALIGVGGIFTLIAVIAMAYRVVVPTNMVDIVQTRNTRTAYGGGAGAEAGNVYYSWPSWIPIIGITSVEFPLSNFDLSLKNYEAYDRDRVPFMVDVTAFFRIIDPTIAAERISSYEELIEQLTWIVQGAVRKVLASAVIDTIMLERAEFGDKFTDEVEVQLKEWGVGPVKAMELMDIRDTANSKSIHNIMAKKTSHIEMDSRKEVAQNMQQAQTAEITAQQTVQVRQQEADQAVGERTAQKEQAVGIALQKSRQEVLTEEKVTRERSMEVERVNLVKQAEIEKDRQVVAADQDKQTNIIKAEGQLEARKREAEGIRQIGIASADAEKAKQLAPVAAQIELAKEIGKNKEYQNYLISIESISAYIQVGKENAKALQAADIKVIANSDKATEGLNNIAELFTSKGGTKIGAMVEGLAQTPAGAAVLAQLGVETKPNGAHNGDIDKNAKN